MSVVFFGEDEGVKLSVRDKIIRLRSTLCDYIEPDMGLLDKMLSVGVLTNRHVAHIRRDAADDDKTQRMLTCLLDNEQTEYDLFMKCLENTDQKHVVNYISSNGG